MSSPAGADLSSMRRWAHEIACCYCRNRIFPNWRYYRINKRILIPNSPGRVSGLFYCSYTTDPPIRQTCGAGPETHTICIIKTGELPRFFMPRQQSLRYYPTFPRPLRRLCAPFLARFSHSRHIYSPRKQAPRRAPGSQERRAILITIRIFTLAR